MCFTIDQSAVAPANKKVFKIVRITGSGFVLSPFKDFEWKQRGRYKAR